MTISQVALLGLILLGSHIESSSPVDLRPVWTLSLRDAYLGKNNSGTYETIRSCGIARWDNSHVLIYYLTANKHLAVREPVEKMEGGWSFSVQIVQTDSGAVEQSYTIPAWGSNSELAVVAAGIVESDHHRLIFYSRSFKRIEPPFTYAPLPDSHLPPGFDPLDGLQHLYVSNDEKTFVLVNGGRNFSRFFLFDGSTFEKKKDWVLPDVDWENIHLSDDVLFYTNFDGPRRVYGTTFDGRFGLWKSWYISPDNKNCLIPIYYDSDTYLGVCGSVELIHRADSVLIYQPLKSEQTGYPVALSPDKNTAAIFNFYQKGAGALDLTERRTRVGLLIVNLDGEHHACKIPIMPIPKSQLAFQFADNSTLIILNDATVTAYKEPCPH